MDVARASDNTVNVGQSVNHSSDAARAGNTADEAATTARATSQSDSMNHYRNPSGSRCSFRAATPVLTEEGLEAISQLKVGDAVFAYHEALEDVGVYTITAVWAHLDPEIVVLTIDGEHIETTPEHPFSISADRWVAAGDLWLGAQVRQADGSYGLVEAIQVEQRPQVMYNLTVDEAHTYFVGDGQWLVHNTCSSPEVGRLNLQSLNRIQMSVRHAELPIASQEWEFMALVVPQ